MPYYSTMISFERGLEIDLVDELATQAFASALASKLEPGLVIYLYGDLGAGKTTLVRGMLSALGQQGAIKSPTYTLVESYLLGNLDIYHFDLYRLNEPAELEDIGIKDYLSPTAICVFEWADKGLGYIPQADIEVTIGFSKLGRRLKLMANSELGIKVLKEMTVG